MRERKKEAEKKGRVVAVGKKNKPTTPQEKKKLTFQKKKKDAADEAEAAAKQLELHTEEASLKAERERLEALQAGPFIFLFIIFCFLWCATRRPLKKKLARG